MPNSQNEKLVAINFERVQYWLGQGAGLTNPVAQVPFLNIYLQFKY
jgi:small subunit ribosomal protein S16